MSPDTTISQAPRTSSICCKLLVRKEREIAEVTQFVVEGIQVGQQVVTMGGANFLREVAQELTSTGLKTDALLRNGRLVFLTAPNCISSLMKPDDPGQRVPLRSNAPLLRWITDWSWAYRDGNELHKAVEVQRRIHDFVRSLGALSVCTVDNPELHRNSLLALLADHRRAMRLADKTSSPSADVIMPNYPRRLS